MHIALAPFRLRQGITEEGLVAASDAFEEEFVRHQDGILRRILVRDVENGFADVVFFEDDEAIRRVMEAEQNSEVCAAFFSIMDGEGQHRVYEVIKTYEPAPASPPRSQRRGSAGSLPTSVRSRVSSCSTSEGSS